MGLLRFQLSFLLDLDGWGLALALTDNYGQRLRQRKTLDEELEVRFRYFLHFISGI